MLTIKQAGFQNYLDEKGDTYVKLLIVGSAGSGKTRMASQAPGAFFMDTDGGMMSVADKGTPYVSVKSIKDMEEMLVFLEKEAIKPRSKRTYETLVIDTLDGLQKFIIQDLLDQQNKESMSDYRDWGRLGNQMTRLFNRLKRLPMNIVVLCHEKAVKGEGDDGLAGYELKLQGDAKQSAPEAFDFIGHAETAFKSVEGKRTLTYGIRWRQIPTMQFIKDRSNRLPAFQEVAYEGDQAWTDIMAAIASGLDDLPEGGDVGVIDEPEEKEGEAVLEADGGPVDQSQAKAAQAKAVEAKAAKKAAAPAKKAAASAAAPAAPRKAATVKVAPPKEAYAKPAPEPTPEPVATPEEAKATVQEQLGAVEVQQEAPKPPVKVEPKPETGGPACGQPKEGPPTDATPQGCGKPMSEFAQSARVRGLLKFKTYLCPEHYEAAMAARKK